jgi:hypothetical protein
VIKISKVGQKLFHNDVVFVVGSTYLELALAEGDLKVNQIKKETNLLKK